MLSVTERKLRNLLAKLEGGRITAKQARRELTKIRADDGRTRELIRDIRGMVER
jgi:hypothetical protein